MSAAAGRWLTGFLLGALTVGGFAPFHLFPLPLLTLAALFVLARDARAARAAGLFFAFGLGYFLAGVSWVYVSLHDFGGMPAALAALATVLFCAYLALFPALAGAAWSRARTGRALPDALLAGAAWTLADWVRGWLFTGFPWLALGYAQSPPSPLAGFAPVLGVHGLTFLTVALGAGIARAWPLPRRLLLAGAGLALAGAAGAALHAVEWTAPRERALRVSLLQGNIEQGLKWKPERLTQSLHTYLELAAGHPSDLVVLPETALPLLLQRLPPEYAQRLKAASGGDVLLGIVAADAAGRYYNSAVGLSGDALQRYDKSHLVPFGEFTPPLFAWTLAVLSIPMSNFASGPAVQPPLALAGERVAVNICYEDVFGAEIRASAPAATVLVNLSNTAWFGDSLAQPQHLQIAQMRALETGRPMLRATNTGMTAAVSAQGEVDAVLAPFTAGALQVSVRGRSGLTPYLRWGDAPVLLLCLAAVGAAVLRRRLDARAAARNDGIRRQGGAK